MVFYMCSGHHNMVDICNCPGPNYIIHITICPCNPKQSGIILGNGNRICIYSEYTTIKNIEDYFKSLSRNKWLRDENWQAENVKLTKESCEFLIDHLGFIPSVKRVWSTYSGVGYPIPKLCYDLVPIKMTTFMGIDIPQALVNEMSFVVDTRDELNVLFGNYEPQLMDFPKPLQDHVYNAITALSRGGDITNILYIAIYEFLGIHITNRRITIHRDLLLRCSKLPRWTLKFDPPKDCLIGLTGGELEFISDHVVRTFGLAMPGIS